MSTKSAFNDASRYTTAPKRNGCEVFEHDLASALWADGHHVSDTISA